MNNPQTEAGFVKIATGKEGNDILSALYSQPLSGREFRVVLCVIRSTWGYGKKVDWISYTQFEKKTGLNRSSVYRAIESLVAKRILVADKQLGKTFYGFNKLFNEWLVADKQLVAEQHTTSCRTATQLVADKQPTKENITKENIQKKNGVGVDHFLFSEYERISKRRVEKPSIYVDALRSALKAFTPEEIVQAWAAMQCDGSLTGDNDRKKNYFTLEYGLRPKKLSIYLSTYKENA